MDPEITRATIVNWALIDLGHPASFSIDVENEIGGIVDLIWPRMVDKCFGLHDWTFCRKTFALDRLTGAPDTGYAWRFALPGNKIGDPLKVSTDPRQKQPLREYQLEGMELHADEPAIWARCRVTVDPRYWDPAFRTCFVAALAGALAMPLMQDPQAAAELTAKAFGAPREGGAGGEFGRLIAQNMAAEPKGSPFDGYDVLVDARRM